MAGNHKRFLVIARAGDTSLHRRYADGNGDFDVYVAYFGAQRGRFATDGTYYAQQAGYKYKGIADILAEHPELLAQYEAFWLPDDDLAATSDLVSRMFTVFMDGGFDLAQPALTSSSAHSYAITLAHRGFRYRRTDFVEVMAPIFTAKALDRCRSTFHLNNSSWGLDLLWREGLGPSAHLGVLDSVAVEHTRAIRSGPLYGSLGQLPEDDLVDLSLIFALQSIDSARPVNLSGTLLDGRQVQGRALARRIICSFPWFRTSPREASRYFREVLASIPNRAAI